MDDFKEMYTEALMRYALVDDEPYDFSGRMEDIFKYCIITRTSDGLDEFLKLRRDQQTDYLVQRVADEYGFDASNNQDLIALVMKKRIIDEGYVCHSTNSSSAENIMTTGLLGNTGVSTIYDELAEFVPESYMRTDMNYLKGQAEKDQGWFFDRTPKNYLRYATAPEWFRRFVSTGNYRDHDQSVNWINNVVMAGQPEEKKEQALEFFEKHWEKYKDVTPHILLIPNGRHLQSVQEKSLISSLDTKTRIDYFTDFYFRINDNNSKIDVPPTDIIDIDVKLEKQKYNERKNGAISV